MTTKGPSMGEDPEAEFAGVTLHRKTVRKQKQGKEENKGEGLDWRRWRKEKRDAKLCVYCFMGREFEGQVERL